MALTSTLSGSSVVYEERIIGHHTRTYNWPPLQLNFWIFVMLLASTSIVGVFSIFIQTQQQLGLLIPWYVGTFAALGGVSLFTNCGGNQVLSVLHHSGLPGDSIRRGHRLAHCQPTAATGYCYDWLIYDAGDVDGRVGGRLGGALGADGHGAEQLQLAGVFAESYGIVGGNAGVAAAEEYM